MTTKLEGALRREFDIRGQPYTLTISPAGFNLVPKGRRKGHQLSWDAIVSGDAALATALNASLANATEQKPFKSSRSDANRKRPASVRRAKGRGAT
jgi:hypothetical protein